MPVGFIVGTRMRLLIHVLEQRFTNVHISGSRNALITTHSPKKKITFLLQIIFSVVLNGTTLDYHPTPKKGTIKFKIFLRLLFAATGFSIFAIVQLTPNLVAAIKKFNIGSRFDETAIVQCRSDKCIVQPQVLYLDPNVKRTCL